MQTALRYAYRPIFQPQRCVITIIKEWIAQGYQLNLLLAGE
jgi:hypothetical protein